MNLLLWGYHSTFGDPLPKALLHFWMVSTRVGPRILTVVLKTTVGNDITNEGCILSFSMLQFFWLVEISKLAKHHWNSSLVLRPTPFFVLRLAFNVMQEGRRARKMGKALEHLSHEWPYSMVYCTWSCSWAPPLRPPCVHQTSFT